MSRPFFLNNKKFISTKDASKLTGYTSDYIGQISRMGKVESTVIGRARFVEEASLLLYLQTAENGHHYPIESVSTEETLRVPIHTPPTAHPLPPLSNVVRVSGVSSSLRNSTASPYHRKKILPQVATLLSVVVIILGSVVYAAYPSYAREGYETFVHPTRVATSFITNTFLAVENKTVDTINKMFFSEAPSLVDATLAVATPEAAAEEIITMIKNAETNTIVDAAKDNVPFSKTLITTLNPRLFFDVVGAIAGESTLTILSTATTATWRAGDALFLTAERLAYDLESGLTLVAQAFIDVTNASDDAEYGFGQAIGGGFIRLARVPRVLFALGTSSWENESDENPALSPQSQKRTARIFLPENQLVAVNAGASVGDVFDTAISFFKYLWDLLFDRRVIVLNEAPIIPTPLPIPPPSAPTFPPIFTSESADATPPRVIETQTVLQTVYVPAYVPPHEDGISITELAIAIISLREELVPLIEQAMVRPRSSSRGGGGGGVNSEDLDNYLLLSGGTLTGGLGGTNATFSGDLSSATLTVTGSTTFNSVEYLFPSSDGTDNYILTTDGNGALTWEAGAVGGITSLNGLTAAAQDFATSSDTNIGLTIVSSGSTHTFTPTWMGTLAANRGGTGTSTVNANELLIGNSAGTAWTTIATSSLGIVSDHGLLTGLSDDDHTQYALLAGRSSGQTLSGGTGSGENLTLNSTAHATKGILFIDGNQFGLAYANNEGYIYENGVPVIEIEATSVFLRSDGQFGFNDAPGVNSTHDVGIARDSAGVLRVTNGGAGVGALTASYYVATSTAATSTFSGGLSVGTGGLNISGHIRGVAENTYLSFDAGADRLGLIKKTGDFGKLAYGSAATFQIAQSSGITIDPSNTFTTRLIVDASGNVGIGTTSPYAKLSVAGDVAITAGLYDNTASRGSNGYVLQSTGTGLTWVATSSLGIGGSSGWTDGGTVLYTTSGESAQADFFTATSTTATSSFVGNVSVSGLFQAANNLTISSFGGGTWVNMPTTGPSGIGNGGAGSNAWIAYAASPGQWFNGSAVGDLAYRNTGGKLLFGNTAGAPAVTISGDNVGIGTITPTNARLMVQGVAGTTNIFELASSTGTNLLTVTGAGNVGIGTTSPYAKLSVVGDVAITGGLYDSLASRGLSGYLLQSTGTGLTWVATSSLGISGGTASSTTGTIKVGWPDVIYCTVTSPALGDVAFYLGEDVSGETYYMAVWAGYYLRFNSTTKAFAGYTGVTTSNCNSSISQLTSEGKAKYFANGIGAVAQDADNDTKIMVEKNTDEDKIRFDTAGTERMIIDNGGLVGIGTTTPWRTLSVVGTVGLSSSLTSGTTGNYLCINTSTYEVTSGTTCSASSARFKENIVDLNYGLDEIKALRPVTFNYKKEYNPDGSTRLGLIAEEVNQVIPEVVNRDKNGLIESVSYDNLISLLIKGIQELSLRLDAIEVQLAAVGNSISTSFAHFTEIVVDTFTVGSEEVPTGITLFDEMTGKPYCLSVRNGETVTRQGECGEEAEEPPTEEHETEDSLTDEMPTDEPSSEESPTDIPPVDEPPQEEGSTDEEPPVDESETETPPEASPEADQEQKPEPEDEKESQPEETEPVI